VKTHLVWGNPSREILAKARREGADLIVMGTHGRSGLPHMVMGSVAEKTVRRSGIPVLTVPLAFEPRRRRFRIPKRATKACDEDAYRNMITNPALNSRRAMGGHGRVVAITSHELRLAAQGKESHQPKRPWSFMTVTRPKRSG